MCDIVIYLYQDILVIIICAHGDLSIDHDSYYLLGNFTEHQVLQINNSVIRELFDCILVAR